MIKKQAKLMLGDNMESLKKLPDNSIDSIVTDPPYGLSFMGKKWDYDVPSVEFWKEVYRVLKPGGHILSFGGTRTYHRMVVNIEDAGFEIRDQVMWLYGSGFPKSHNISKAIDKVEGNERKVIGRKIQRVDGTLRGVGSNGAPFLVDGVEGSISKPTDGYIDIEEPGSENSKRYEGWGTALKPANEPICVARKPLSEKTIADNVIKWGTGGINIDGCRVEGAYGSGQNEVIEGKEAGQMYHRHENGMEGNNYKQKIMVSNPEGRFPANIILDETAAELLDEQSGISKPSKERFSTPGGHTFGGSITEHNKNGIGRWPGDNGGGASRFFYVAKVSKKERNLGLDNFEEKDRPGQEGKIKCINCNRWNSAGDDRELCVCDETEYKQSTAKNNHPTLKPINLMTYLCRLITPEGGIVLDPFMGSGSTGISALLEGFRFVGMEMDADYFKIAEARIEAYEEYRILLKK